MEPSQENVVQAVVIMDLFKNNFSPINKTKPMAKHISRTCNFRALLSVAGVPLIDYVLESLGLGGVGETILFCCQDGPKIKEHIKTSKEKKSPWSLTMDVQVIMSDTCQTMGDVMREIDAAGLVRGYFVLLGVNSITNVNFATLLEEHKLTCKKDKEAAMTLIYKRVSWEHPLIKNNKPLFLAADGNTNKVLIHEKTRSNNNTLQLPLDCILSHSEAKLHHNLVDANIALCSPSVLPLFADNFDFQTRDDFVNGVLINEEILASSLYYKILKENQYAAAITNWKTYQIVSWDILHNWVYPLSIETGSFFQNNYIFMENHNFRKITSKLSRSCTLVEDVLIGADTEIYDNTTITKTMIDSLIENGTIIAENVNKNEGSKLKGAVIECSEQDKNDKNLVKSTSESGTEWENESDGSGDDEFVGFDKVWSDSESCYSSDSSAQSSLPESPVPEDTNIFLQEVIDSLARGYEEKLKCDYLILEINSSRYAYNIQLHEVNFFVIRAMLSIPILVDSKSVLVTVKDILKFFRPILSNYIKTKSSIMDCLRAVEESCIKCDWLEGKAGQILHLLYETDVVDEDSLVEWYDDLKDNESPLINQTSLVKFFEWLQEASEESEESE
ncbi:Translation initiation factor eIF-2B subunit epsilon [Papilio xuthus]|uniref:Translation initiation factor eIF2B subunit epsilon n=1 Tax=Papilio xuthus TaxID=66420 RepID=A0A194QAF2_PAPXU|nr:Translation initiation factor eIF-2B subunit epsilon [Papilio xuthus]